MVFICLLVSERGESTHNPMGVGDSGGRSLQELGKVRHEQNTLNEIFLIKNETLNEKIQLIL